MLLECVKDMLIIKVFHTVFHFNSTEAQIYISMSLSTCKSTEVKYISVFPPEK